MKFTAKQDFTSLAELLRLYGDADEIVFKSHCQLDESEIAEICRDARRLSHHVRLHHGTKSAEQIVASYGGQILRDAWQVAEGKIIYFAECSIHSKTGSAIIRVNTDAIKSLTGLMAYWASDVELEFFTEAKVDQVVIAHELFHLIEQRSLTTSVELAAHAFARALTQLPFSPLLYNTLLARLAAGKQTLH